MPYANPWSCLRTKHTTGDLLGEWIFVRAGPVNRWHRNIQHPKIDRELPAMVVDMIEQHRAQKPDARS